MNHVLTVTGLLTAIAAAAIGYAVGRYMDKFLVKLVRQLPPTLKKSQIEIDIPNGRKINLKRSEVTPEKVDEITRSVAMHV